MINDLIRGDWHIIDSSDHFHPVFITRMGNFDIKRAEEHFEEVKKEYPEKKLELLLVVSR